MSVAERVLRWNRWYDEAPEDWRFQFVVWSLLAIGTVNMLLTVAVGFPFALLVVVGIICLTAIRVPYVLGWVAPPGDALASPTFRITGAGWLIDLNNRYDAMPEARRIWVYPAVLLIAGAINMMLTIDHGFPFGLLFLLALLALVVFRAPYTAGWLQSPTPVHPAVGSGGFDLISQHTSSPAVEEYAVPPAVKDPDEGPTDGPGFNA